MGSQKTVVNRYHFAGAVLDTAYTWNEENTGSSSAALGSDADAVLTLEATDEAQCTALNFGGARFDIDRLRRVEIVAKVGTLAATEEIALGVYDAHDDDPDSVAVGALFRCDGTNAITLETDDGTNDVDDVAAGEDATADTYRRYVIDFASGVRANDPRAGGNGGGKADVRFFVGNANGNLRAVGQSQIFDMSNYSGSLQPCLLIAKASGTGTTALSVREVIIELDESA